MLFFTALASVGLDLLFLGKSQLGSGRDPPVHMGFLAALGLGIRVFCYTAPAMSTRDRGQDDNVSPSSHEPFPIFYPVAWPQHPPDPDTLTTPACSRAAPGDVLNTVGVCLTALTDPWAPPWGCANSLLPTPHSSIPPASLSPPDPSEETSDKRNSEQKPGAGKWQARACVRSAGSPGGNN